MSETHPRPPAFREAWRFWLKLGLISFGGPTGQIAIMHRELVERKKWIGEKHFLHALNYCMLLPGPEATQLATYCGWLLHRTRGGLAAGILFVLPSALLLWALSWVYATCGQLPWIAAIFHGLKPVVTAIVLAAMIRLGRRALSTPASWILAAAAFLGIFFIKLPFPLIIGVAALLGFFGAKIIPSWFSSRSVPEKDGTGVDDAPGSAPHTRPSWTRAFKVTGLSLVLWWTPVLLAGYWQGWDGTLVRTGVFFSKASMVTFGGAYAVLPYVGQQAVENYHWLSAPQMLDGLGLAETTPGPLIIVVQFVGFLGGWTHPGTLSPLAAATLGAAMTIWTTFVPCFLWIFLGAPHIEQLRGKTRLESALAAITAAVVGVVLNLAVWFGLHVFFPPGGRIDWFAIAVAAAAFVALQRFKAGVVTVVLAGGALGWLYGWL